MLAARWLLLLAVTGCGARTSLESPFFSETGGESEVEACTGWTIDGPPFVIPSLVPAETSDIAPSLVPFQDGSVSLLLLRARPPDAPRELVRWRLQSTAAWPPPRADEVIVNGFCDARLTDSVDGAFGALVKDQAEGCQLSGGIRWFSPIEATFHPPLPLYDASVWSIIAAAQGPDHGLLVLDVGAGEELLRLVDSNGAVLREHPMPCAGMTRTAAWFDGHYYVMGKAPNACAPYENSLSVFRVDPKAGSVDVVAKWTTGAIEATAIVSGNDELWYAWRNYALYASTGPVELVRANGNGELVTDPMRLRWTERSGAFAIAALRDRFVLARYQFRNNQTASVAVDWIDRNGALLEQVTFPVEPGGAWLDVAVDDHTAIVAWDSYATEISAFRVWLGRASCR